MADETTNEYGIHGTTLNFEHLVLKANNAAAWPEDYVLLAGELGIELDTKKYKLGDGTTAWKTLGYYSNPVTDKMVEDLTTRVTSSEGKITTLESDMTTAKSDITELKSTDTAHETRMGTIEAKDSAQDSRLDALDGTNGEIAQLKAKDTAQDNRLTAIENITTISANPFRA